MAPRRQLKRLRRSGSWTARLASGWQYTLTAMRERPGWRTEALGTARIHVRTSASVGALEHQRERRAVGDRAAGECLGRWRHRLARDDRVAPLVEDDALGQQFGA